jgi:uncharacterized RDD family membrane protein YckC
MSYQRQGDIAWKRFLSGAIDYVVICVFFFAYVMTFGEPNAEGGKTVTGLPGVVPVVFWFCWLVLSESIFGTTLGHYINRLKVISIDGDKPTFSQSLRRRLCDPLEISWCFGLVAFILIKNTQLNQRLGDIWAKTIVVAKNYQLETTQFEFEQENVMSR